MLGKISSWFVRLLAFVVYALHRVGATAEQLPISVAGAVVEENGVASITAGPKFPALMKRQGSSFIGYISSGAGYVAQFCLSGTWTAVGGYGGCCTATNCNQFFTRCGSNTIYNQNGGSAVCPAGCVTDFWFPSSGAAGGVEWIVCDSTPRIYYAISPTPVSVVATTSSIESVTITQSSVLTVTSLSVSVQPAPQPNQSPTPSPTPSPKAQSPVPTPAKPTSTTEAQTGGQNPISSNPPPTQPAEVSTVTVVVSSTSYSTSGSFTSAVVLLYTTTSVNVGAIQSGSNTPTPIGGSSSSNKGKIIGAAVVGLLGLAGVLVCLSMRRKRSGQNHGAPGESPAPLVYAEPKPTYPTPPIPNPYGHGSPSPTSYYYQPHSPSELSGGASPPIFHNQPVYQPPPSMSQPQPYNSHVNQGFQVGRSELANSNLAPIHEMGNSYAPGPGSRY